MRLLAILWVLTRYRLLGWLPTERLPLFLRIALYIFPGFWLPKVDAAKRGLHVRKACEELGPVFIKFGQMLSTRCDLLPDEMAAELALLQDSVPPFAGDIAVNIIEASLKKSLAQCYADFDRTPLASASIAQVHAATLLTGERVVVKVVRPHLITIIRKDMALLLTLATQLESIWAPAKRLRLIDLVNDYQHTIEDELDLFREAANTSQLKRHFANTPLLFVPTVYWDYTRKDIFTMERIEGISVTDIPRLQAANVNMKVLAERGVEIFFTQVFSHNFFHADMHPGNIFVNATHPEDPQYIAIDCAIMGSLSDEDQQYLARNFLAFFKRDYKEVARLHIDSGWIPASTRLPDFEAAIRSVCEPIFEKPLKDMSFGLLLLRLFQTAQRFDMHVQPQLVLLQKTLLYIEGLGRQLYPELDLWNTAKPFLEKWMKEQHGLRGFAKSVMQESPHVLAHLPELPRLAWDVLNQLNSLDKLSAAHRQSISRLEQALVTTTQKRRCHTLGALALLSALVFWQYPSQLLTVIQPWLSTLATLIGLYGLSR